MNTDYINKAFHHYLMCALWSSVNSMGEPLDDYLDVTDFDDIDMTEHKDELISFITKAWTMLVDNQIKAEQCGHDFWLTRNGHGAGFWDRGYGEDGNKLTALCEQFGESDITEYFSDPYDNSVEEMNSIPTLGESMGMDGVKNS